MGDVTALLEVVGKLNNLVNNNGLIGEVEAAISDVRQVFTNLKSTHYDEINARPITHK